MTNIADIQAQHPEYKDMSADAFADKLYNKFYSDMPREEFDKKLNTKKQTDTGTDAVKETRNTLSSINEHGIAETLGMPVDAVNWGLKKLGLPTSETPIGGSKSIKRGMRALNMSEEGAEPETMVGKATAATVGGAVSALMAGGGAGALAKEAGTIAGSPALREVGKVLASPGGNIAAGGGGGAGGSLGKEVAKGTPFEKPAEIAGEFIGGAAAGLAPAARLRGLAAAEPVLDAYERLGLAPSAAEAGVGGRTAQWLEGNILPQTAGGGNVMEQFKQKRLREMTDIQQSIAEQYGGAKPREEMGNSVQESVMDTWNKAKDDSGKIIGNLRNKYGEDVVYAENLVNAVVKPKGAASTKEIREMTQDPIVNEAAAFIRMTGGHFTFADLAALKTKYGSALEPGFQKNVNDAQVGQIYDALRNDMERHIKLKSPEDFNMLKAANEKYAKAQTEFKQYFKKLIGSKNIPVSSERAYEIVTGAASEKGRGNLEQFRHVWDALPGEERGNLAATILSRLGATDKGHPGNVESWSLGKFLSGYKDLAPEAKDMLFKGKKDVARELDDLVAVAQNIEQKVARLASTSKSGTGAIMLGQFGLGTIIAHATSGDLFHGVLYGYGGPWLAAQILTNPTAVKGLAGTMRLVDAAVDASARAAFDLNVIPKLPVQQQPPLKQTAPQAPTQQYPQLPMSQ